MSDQWQQKKAALGKYHATLALLGFDCRDGQAEHQEINCHIVFLVICCKSVYDETNSSKSSWHDWFAT